MKELKTLKDFESNKDFLGDNILRDELKAEAIKWWKQKHNFGEDVCCTCEEMWRDFFDLIEEDLEEKEK